MLRRPRLPERKQLEQDLPVRPRVNPTLHNIEAAGLPVDACLH